MAALVDFARGHELVVVAVDNMPGARRLETAELPGRACCSSDRKARRVRRGARAAQMVVSIAQFGSTRSINAGVAAGIAMHAWVRQHADLARAW